MTTAKKVSNVTNIKDLKESEEAKMAKQEASATKDKPEEKKEKKFEMDMAAYLLKGYVSEDVNIKGVTVTIRTLTQEEAITVLQRIAKIDMSSKAHADAILTALTVGLAVVAINGEPLAARKEFAELGEFIDARYEWTMSVGISLLDKIYLEYSRLNRNVSEYLSEPEEALKN